jgi:hypothetical protein
MKRWLLVGVVALGFLLRFWQLGKYPVGFTPDEASFGYDAYSLLKTGKDQWGSSWPISFRSFGDFKLPVYTYLTIPSVAVFGLNEFAVRLPSAIIGVLAILATYLASGILFKDKRVALLAALLLAISPWHLSLSRGAFEANLTVFFMALGVWVFHKGLSNRRWLVVSALMLGINLFTYHSARLVTPLVLFILFLVNRRELGVEKFKNIGQVVLQNWLPVIIFVFLLMLAFSTIFTGSGARAADITIFNPTDKWESVFNTRYGAVFGGLPYGLAVFFHNKVFDVFSRFIVAYSTYVSPQFLFTQGAGEWTYGMVAGWGVLYLVEFLFVAASFWFLAKEGFGKSKPLTFLVCWMLVGFIPAALTKGPGYAGNRAAVVMPAIQMFSAFGAVLLFDFLARRIYRYLLLFVYSFILLVSLIFFLEAYRFVAPRLGADGMLYGRKEALAYIIQNEDKYNEIIVSRNLSEPQIYVAFYTKYDPLTYQKASREWLKYKEVGVPFVDQLGEYHLGKYVFKNINYMDDSKIPNVLIVGKPSEFPQDMAPTYLVKYPNQLPDIYIVDPSDVGVIKTNE